MPGSSRPARSRPSSREIAGSGWRGLVANVKAFARGRGARIIRDYREIDSDKQADRPEYLRAVARAMRGRATLVVTAPDRLARNAAFTANLIDSAVDFVACDNPHANRLTIRILAAVAENEAKMMSDRTKAAPAAYEARGGQPGAARPNGRRLTGEDGLRGREAARKAVKARTDAAYADLAPTMVKLRDAGLSLREIAAALNAEGRTTRRGMQWNAMQVSRVLERGFGSSP